jgi:hypothetical protein
MGSPALLLQAGAMGACGAILALANIDVEGLPPAWEGDGPAQAALINGHRANGMAGIAGLKRASASSTARPRHPPLLTNPAICIVRLRASDAL